MLAGYLNVPAALGGSAFLEHFLEPSLHVPAMEGAEAVGEHADHTLEIAPMIVSSLIALAGIAIASFLYLKRTDIPDTLAAKYPGVYEFLGTRVHRRAYDAMIVQPSSLCPERALEIYATVVEGARQRDGTISLRHGALVRRFSGSRCARMRVGFPGPF